jgi:hypothetical protein
MSVLEIDIYVISLNDLDPMHSVFTYFPSAKRFPAVDRRHATMDDVKDIVTSNAQLTLKRGRKWHHELSSMSAVGLYESNRQILNSGDNPVIIFEEDVVIDGRIVSALDVLKFQMKDFDVIVFGPIHTNSIKESIKLQDFCTIQDEFWGTHAVLYSKQGRKKVAEELNGLIDMQIDAKLARMAMFNNLRLFVQCNSIPLATQSEHVSTIQEKHGSCPLCNKDPQNVQNRISFETIAWVLIISLILVSLINYDAKSLAYKVMFLLIVLVVYSYRRINKSKFHVVVVCTPNYDIVGAYGVNSLKKYCENNGYQFTLWREKIEDLHVNFTKNEAVLNTLRRTDADYVVSIDADVAIYDINYTLDNFLVDNDVVMYAPEDYWWGSSRDKNSIINAGFVIWKKCDRAIEINKLWLSEAYNGCAKGKVPPQQSVFDDCVYPHMHTNEMHFIDHELVGMPYSKIIAQTKHGRDAWKALGEPNEPLDITTLPMKITK